MILALLPLVAGPAEATYPVPPFEESIVVNKTYAIVEDEVFDKNPTVDERCLPRHSVCVGPFDPDIDVGIGQTGVIVISNESNVTVGHDPSRHEEFGPYVVPTLLLDDFRVCWSGCIIPNSVYASAELNLTVEVWVLGSDVFTTEIKRNVTYDRIPLVPREFCTLAQHGCPP